MADFVIAFRVNSPSRGADATSPEVAARDAWVDLMGQPPAGIQHRIADTFLRIEPQQNTQTWNSLQAINNEVRSQIERDSNMELSDLSIHGDADTPFPDPIGLLD